MEAAMLRTIMVLLHLLHTPIIFYQDQWAEEVPSRAPHAALEGCSNMLMVPRGFFQKRNRTTREVNLKLYTSTINNRGVSFSSFSSSSHCVLSAGTGGSTTGGSRSHHQNPAKQGYHSNHGNHHHQPTSTQHSHPPSHVSSSVSSHSLGLQEGRKRGRRKRSSAAAVSACSSPKRRSFLGIGSNGHSSGSPLNINSMVSPSV